MVVLKSLIVKSNAHNASFLTIRVSHTLVTHFADTILSHSAQETCALCLILLQDQETTIGIRSIGTLIHGITTFLLSSTLSLSLYLSKQFSSKTHKLDLSYLNDSLRVLVTLAVYIAGSNFKTQIRRNREGNYATSICVHCRRCRTFI